MNTTAEIIARLAETDARIDAILAIPATERPALTITDRLWASVETARWNGRTPRRALAHVRNETARQLRTLAPRYGDEARRTWLADTAHLTR